MPRLPSAVPVVLACLALAGCATAAPAAPVEARDGEPAAAQEPAPAPDPQPGAEDAGAPDAGPPDAGPQDAAVGDGAAAARPDWLGTRVLPLRPDGLGEIQPTPPELEDRRLPPPPGLPPPASGEFAATITPVPAEVAARSTWASHCPVALEDLRYLTVGFWGFDDRPHTGELLVHASVADAVAGVFRRLHDARFPIEEMRVVHPAELDAPPTGDGNNTTAFVCRSMVSSGSWSQHAYGLAVDINPFHNPYARGDVVIPELASSYVDRARHRPGMVTPGDPVTQAFAAIGWPWGGDWRSAKDWMHFSHNGR